MRVGVRLAIGGKIADPPAHFVDVLDALAGGVDQLREHIDPGWIVCVLLGGVSVYVAVVHDRIVKQNQARGTRDFSSCQTRLKMA
ncbi:hypothetical protein CF165_48330 [Amycolatopsis vastitatis]|uniref:Uncharacterized protein n=1 Tax=Amycolatopsis vastitatis TaxID=1905142 RepID=A0A229SKD5_9PSEU|nr:hypothetical protein CF165_48330 [Amycolatopsis vastitatis]